MIESYQKPGVILCFWLNYLSSKYQSWRKHGGSFKLYDLTVNHGGSFKLYDLTANLFELCPYQEWNNIKLESS